MDNLKYLRCKAILTQEDVAFKLNVDRSTIAKWETGKSMPRADKLSLLAKLLNCSIDDLFKSNT